jgi:tetratricopeptide (TPR) repeat protein
MVLSLALLAPFVSGCPSKQGPTPEELALIIDNKLEIAANMRLNNKLDDAEEIFKWVIEKDDTRAAAWYGLGEVRAGQDNQAEAGQLFQKAVQLAPTDRAAQAALGRFLAASGDHAGAVKALAVAYGDSLEDPKIALAYGISLRESGDLANAEKILREVAEEDEYLEHVYTELGDVLRAQKRTDDALRAYLKAQKLHASDRRAQAGGALIYEEQGRYKYAADAWSLYIRMDCCTEYSKTVAQVKLKEMEAKEQAQIDAAAEETGDASP